MFIIQATPDEGITFGEILRQIPHDGPAIVGYVILALFAAFVWWGSRSAVKRTEDSANGNPPSSENRS